MPVASIVCFLQQLVSVNYTTFLTVICLKKSSLLQWIFILTWKKHVQYACCISNLMATDSNCSFLKFGSSFYSWGFEKIISQSQSSQPGWCLYCLPLLHRASSRMRMGRNTSTRSQSSPRCLRFPRGSWNSTRTSLARRTSKSSRTPAGWVTLICADMVVAVNSRPLCNCPRRMCYCRVSIEKSHGYNTTVSEYTKWLKYH